ncbi:asparagine synthase (glutamine-hydrolyzing) [Spirulina subsalsa FACHB-351]|uniref:asparagine synthase (glutamine-hydrolyzing) n=1 Tax=Spirulina subsalsa FACHB-351 TaxID=234711 RepID=A0ABT3LA39_9CYAN|nr:asparagine synthase (glutamine-hydrolyzing) [Spirulina subsalsa]MCW6038007.1 asparagine synthase (glutamine-hydrolyzing) [Spirulina subsalsa FACHB-351]
MCGIAGYLFTSNNFPLATALSSVKTNLVHRGPDDFGVFQDNAHRVGLVHTRLSILDLSPLGHQPMTSEDGRVVLVFNGEIYNFRELRTALEAQGYSFRGHSDTEVLLNLYLSQRKSGDGVKVMLRRLNGIFAFALWDADHESLLLVRDALGVKPLYYSASKEGLAFASEFKALLPLLPTDRNPLGNLDAAAIDRYLSFLWCPGAGTPTQSIRQLGPGEGIWVNKDEIATPFTWYRLPAFHPHPWEGKTIHRSPAPLTARQAIHRTEQYLRQAVHRQMVADVPVGAFLSGGLDSSSIVTFAREHNPNLQCFTIEVTGAREEGITDDLPYARQVAEHLNVPLEVVQINAARMAEDLPAMVAQLDEPLADPAPLNVLYISRLAREQGIKVLLSGAGGDDLFTGYRRHQALMIERYWAWLPRSVRAQLERLTSGLDQRRSLTRRLGKLFQGAALEGDARLVNYFRWVDRKDLIALYTPDFRAALGDSQAEEPMLDFLAELPPNTHPIERLLALEQRFFLTDHNLTYTDKMSMAVGVEVRVPFLDLDLVEFASQIPPQYKQRGRQGKWVLKKAMEPYLPRDVIYRPKSGFGAPLRNWMRHELRELLADVLSEQSLKHRGLFDSSAVQQLINDNDQGTIDASYTLLSLICIELWCRQFVDQTESKYKSFQP